MRTHTVVAVLVACIWFCAVDWAWSQCPNSIVPRPEGVLMGKDQFELHRHTALVCLADDDHLARTAKWLQQTLYRSTGWVLPVLPQVPDTGDYIRLQIQSEEGLRSEAYALTVYTDSVVVVGTDAAGVFYGMQTLMQLFPTRVFSQVPYPYQRWLLPTCAITDAPRFSYRGAHLDVARHFFDIDFVKQYIDILAYHKLNRFHWHLTDDQAWRIEIQRYPELTRVGAFRSRSEPNAPPAESPYGGYYTQEQIREVVAYAADRHIEVIPEIEMPGHAQAALAAYPWLGCTRGPYTVREEWGISQQVFCAGRDSTFAFIQGVLDEVLALFPSHLIHIGGDECPKQAWNACADCQKRMRDEHLSDAHALQSYFVKRVEAYLHAKGRQLIGWDEIMEGGLAPRAAVMSWRGIEAGVQAAQAGHPVVMCPSSYAYFDHYQANSAFEPRAIGGYTPLHAVYTFDPIPPQLDAEQAKNILGAQANLWTEFIPNPQHALYMLLPRLSAMAEVLWTPKYDQRWYHFKRRMRHQRQRYQALGWAYSPGDHGIEIQSVPQPGMRSALVYLQSEQDTGHIRYTVDGSKPTLRSPIYRKPLLLNETTLVQARLFAECDHPTHICSTKVLLHKAMGAKVAQQQAPHPRYPGSDAQALIDGVVGDPNRYAARWMGYVDKPFELVLDMGKRQHIGRLVLGTLRNARAWIFPPSLLRIWLSDNGTDWRLVQTITPDDRRMLGPNERVELVCTLRAQSARYIKVEAQNSLCPQGHPGAGRPAWLFVDELEVY